VGNIEKFLSRYGNYIFLLIAATHLHFFFQFKFFTTLDGPAHLHNSNLIYHSLFNYSETFSEYYNYNTSPSPNWISHIFETTLRIFFEPDVAEKIFLSVYFLSTVYAFRYFIIFFRPENKISGLAIIPFLFSAFLYLGFYNFCFSFCFLFLILGFWLRKRENIRIKDIVPLAVLFTALYLSHGFIYLFTFFILFLFIAFDLADDAMQLKSFSSSVKKIFFKRGILILVSAIPSLVMFCIYLQNYGTESTYTYLKYEEIIKYLMDIQPMIHMTEEENYYTTIYFYLFLSVFFILSGLRILNFKNRKFIREDIFLLLSFILLVFVFISPDSDMKGGFIILRLCLLFYLFIVLWLLTQNWNKLLLTIFILVLLVTHSFHLHFISRMQQGNSMMAADIYRASEKLEDWSVVLPVNESENWLHHHYSNYLGVKKPVIVLENYEATMLYFPLLWNWERSRLDFTNLNPSVEAICDSGMNFISHEKVRHDYLFFLHGGKKYAPGCDNLLRENLKINYQLKYSSQYCSLYKRNTLITE